MSPCVYMHSNQSINQSINVAPLDWIIVLVSNNFFNRNLAQSFSTSVPQIPQFEDQRGQNSCFTNFETQSGKNGFVSSIPSPVLRSIADDETHKRNNAIAILILALFCCRWMSWRFFNKSASRSVLTSVSASSPTSLHRSSLSSMVSRSISRGSNKRRNG
eukprot:Blabericola_migrator_1__334@NODE_1085_length_5492_cov_16_106544_g743_i0_p5_GENE_NODE_1085_length_5492_cov_16_106544_g743_i0NODE_1085_length_5492_cov_16_106544_g743_i0_p5_ORF_typecomplete_len160_score23_83AzlD/PF05437_12/3_2e03AzlD/PF05437_12/0_41_NODE_1085_length_5492_cov_16_106544_g743_i043704849